MPTLIPTQFHTFFWDIDPQKIDFQKHDNYIIKRLLEWGDFDALEWIKCNYGKEKIITALKNSRDISFKTANFYSHLFNIPRKEIKCFQIRFSLNQVFWEEVKNKLITEVTVYTKKQSNL